ncbi:MAG: GNAT family N-acetyltransferase [Leptolyngbyaceae cyanobacterium bins.302]|nr:GNAT family N-acetyltransferase [Leptolyngbyaceae cyanobacterium bins.302]
MPRSPLVLPMGYTLRQGSLLDRALLLKFMHRTYFELSSQGGLAHLAQTVDQYFSRETPLWWVEWQSNDRPSPTFTGLPSSTSPLKPVACLWIGTAIDQLHGDRQAHIFLLYVDPQHRRQGIGTTLMHHAESWAQERGDRQIGLQVFQSNQAALALYQQLGYETQSLWMVKPLPRRDRP